MNATERGIREQFPLWNKLDLKGVDVKPGKMQIVVGCGTSVHIADSIAAALNMQGHLARAVPGNEWTVRQNNYAPSSVPIEVVALSRSGESTETVAAARKSRLKGIPVVAFTCAPSSSLCHEADRLVEAETHRRRDRHDGVRKSDAPDGIAVCWSHSWASDDCGC
nr:SIS domain-containing protein [Acetobacter persici]